MNQPAESLLPPEVAQVNETLKQGLGIFGTLSQAFSVLWSTLWIGFISAAIGWGTYQTDIGKEWIDKGLDWLKSSTMGAGLLEMIGGFMEMLGMENPWKGATREAIDKLDEAGLAKEFGVDTELAKELHPHRLALFDAGITSIDKALESQNLLKLATTLPEDKAIAILTRMQSARKADGSPLVDSAGLTSSLNAILNDPAASAKLIAERPKLVSAITKDMLGVAIPAPALEQLNHKIGLAAATHYANLLRTDPEKALAAMTADANGLKVLEAFKGVLPSLPDELLPEAFRSAAGKDRLTKLADRVLASEDTRKAFHTLASNGVLQSLQGLAENFDAANAITAFGDPKLREAISGSNKEQIINAIGHLMPKDPNATDFVKLVQYQDPRSDLNFSYRNLAALADFAYIANDPNMTAEQRNGLVKSFQGFMTSGKLDDLDPKATAAFFSDPTKREATKNLLMNLDTTPIKGSVTEQVISSLQSKSLLGFGEVNSILTLNIVSDEASLKWLQEGDLTQLKAWSKPEGVPQVLWDNRNGLAPFAPLLTKETASIAPAAFVPLASLEAHPGIAEAVKSAGLKDTGVTTESQALAPVALAMLKPDQLRPVAIG